MTVIKFYFVNRLKNKMQMSFIALTVLLIETKETTKTVKQLIQTNPFFLIYFKTIHSHCVP
jgi:hypothetical protein